MVKINKLKCICCGACVGVCPTRALTLVNDEILFDKEKCINCGACIKICPANAITQK